MNDKIINLSSKGLMIIIIVIGVVLSGMIMNYGNPYGMGKEETDAIGLEIAKSENADKQGLTQEQLNNFIEEKGVEEKNNMLGQQGEKVSSTLYFSFVIMGLAAFLIVLALVAAIIGSPKKYMMGIVAGVGFAILLFVIYSMSGTDVPPSLVAAETEKLSPGQEGLFTGDNWKIAGWALGSSIFLGIAAAVITAGSSVYKMIKG